MENNTFKLTITASGHKNLPNRILRACDNAKHLGGLSRSTKDTLSEICRFVKQNAPFETIYPRRITIAERIGASERTVYRHLQKLQTLELIQVLEQERKSRNGKFSVSRIRLTAKAAELLGFVDSVKNVIHSEPSANMSVGYILTKPTISMNHFSQNTRNGLPEDLSTLTSNGLRKQGIFKLMKIAKKKNKILSDIVLIVYPYIKNLKGGRLYSYLYKLANGPSDFSVAAANKRKRIFEEAKINKMREKAAIFRQRFSRTALTNREQTKLFLIDDQVRFVQVFFDGRTGTMPMNDLSIWIEGVETGKLVLATLATEQRFTHQT